MSESMSNSDILRQEKESFSNVRMPLQREDDLAGGELPFIVAVIDDLSGNAPGKEKPELSNRQFDRVSRGTLNAKMKDLSPGLEYEVNSTLPKSMWQDEKLHVKLRFNSMDDFDPGRVAQQIPPLKDLLRLRAQLLSLKNMAAADPELKKHLERLVKELAPG